MRLPEGEARARFATVPVVRLGTADGQGRPHVVVVTFAVDGDTIYTAVDQKPKSGNTLKRLRNVGENPMVTMLADHYSDDWETLWWVRADGRAAILADQRQMTAPLRLLANRYWQYRQAPPTGPLLAVTVERWTGWTGAPATGAPGKLSVAVRTSRRLRRHWLFAALLILGAALRAVVLVAYHPALIFPDSVRYLQYAHNFIAGQWSADALRQSGYSVLIIPVMLLHDLWIIPLAQHLAGLATAVLVYAVLIRFGIRTWLAAVAAVPVLFDPLQLVLEQYVLADVWTVFLVMAALVILVWPRERPRERPRRRQGETQETRKESWLPAAACGLLLGLAVTFRDEMLIMIIPAALYVLVAIRPRRRLLTRLAPLIGCFLIPVIGYLGWFDASHGEWNFTTFSGAFLYGRVADFASCQGLNLPAYEKPLCPTQPTALRNADFYEWNPQSPQWTFHPPAGMSRDTVVRDFSLRILRHQPLAYAEAAARDFLYGFSPVRGAGPEKYSPAYLQFHTYVRPDRQAYASIAALGYPAPAVRPPWPPS